MGRKPGRGSTRATGDKRSAGQEQAGGSIGRVRGTDETRRSHLGREMSEPPRDTREKRGKEAKYQEDRDGVGENQKSEGGDESRNVKSEK